MKPHKMQAWLLVLITLLWSQQAVAQAVVATPLPNAKQTFVDQNGHPITGGQVFNYVPNTTVKKTTWSDTGETTQNTNPIVLDAAGRAQIWGQGSYRQVVKDSVGNTVWDAITTAVGSATPTGGSGTDTAPVGSVMAYTGFIIPANWALAYGQTFNRADNPDLLAALTITNATTSCTSGSPTLSGLTDTTQMAVGEPIESSCLPTGATISAIPSGTTLTISVNATATGAFSSTVFPWGNGDGSLTFTLPDLRGRTFAGADAMGGIAASRLTALFYGSVPLAPSVAGGTQSKVLTADNLPPYTPGGTISKPIATITPTTSFVGTATSGLSGGSISTPTGSTGLSIDVSQPTFTGNPQGGSSQPVSAVQPTLTVNYIIKIKPNTSGAGGVTSLNGMFGDVVCDPTLSCAPVGLVNTIGFNPTNLSPLLDAAFSSTQGAILFRGASGWAALPPSASGFVLATQGTGADPHWISNAAPSGILPLANGGLGASQATATANQIPVFPGSSGGAVPTSAPTWFNNAFCSTVGQLIVRTTGTWVCNGSVPLSAQWMGATGNGTTDDTAAIQACINAVETTGRQNGRCYLPEGTYLVSGSGSAIFTITNGLNFYGASETGTAISIASSVPSTRDLFHVTGSGTGYWFHDFTITGSFGRHQFNFDSNNSSSDFFRNVIIERIYANAPAAGNNIYFNNNTSLAANGGVFQAQIRNNNLFTVAGSFALDCDRCGDSIWADHNIIAGTGGAYRINQIAGAGNFASTYNNISAAGMIKVWRAIAPLFAWDELEQAATNTDANNAMIDLDGSFAPISNARVFEQVQALPGTGNPTLVYVGSAINTVIDYSRLSVPAAYAPINITVSASGTVIGAGNAYPGSSADITNNGSTTLFVDTTTANPAGAWTFFTPTFTSSGGAGVSFSGQVASYVLHGKSLTWRAQAVVTLTSAPTSISVTLPAGLTSTAAQSQPCFTINLNSGTIGGIVGAASTTSTASGVVTVTGQTLSLTCTIEVQ